MNQRGKQQTTGRTGRMFGLVLRDMRQPRSQKFWLHQILLVCLTCLSNLSDLHASPCQCVPFDLWRLAASRDTDPSEQPVRTSFVGCSALSWQKKWCWCILSSIAKHLHDVKAYCMTCNSRWINLLHLPHILAPKKTIKNGLRRWKCDIVRLRTSRCGNVALLLDGLVLSRHSWNTASQSGTFSYRHAGSCTRTHNTMYTHEHTQIDR